MAPPLTASRTKFLLHMSIFSDCKKGVLSSSADGEGGKGGAGGKYIVARKATNSASSACTISIVLIPYCSVRKDINTNPIPVPNPWAFAVIAVAKLLWLTGNQTALTLEGMIITGRPTRPMRMWPKCMTQIHSFAWGTNGMKIRMPHPTASIQAPPTADTRRPKRLRNQVKGTVRNIKAIGLYSDRKKRYSNLHWWC